MTLKPILAVNDLCLDTHERPLFKHISFELFQGETLAVMGPSGIGKSMLTKAIAGILPVEVCVAGTVEINAVEVAKTALLQRNAMQRAGFIFQDALKALNSISTIEEQLALALTAKQRRLSATNKDKVVNLLQQLGFTEPSTLLGQYPSQLSGGQRQRICIAIALLGSANLIIADEPTSALDPVTEAQILQLFFASIEQKQAAGLLITHDLCAALACDKLLVIADRTMVAFGKPVEAIRQSAHPFCQQLAKLLPEYQVS